MCIRVIDAQPRLSFYYVCISTNVRCVTHANRQGILAYNYLKMFPFFQNRVIGNLREESSAKLNITRRFYTLRKNISASILKFNQILENASASMYSCKIHVVTNGSVMYIASKPTFH